MATSKTDLSDVGQRITDLGTTSDRETLQGAIGISLQIMQNAYLNKKQEMRADLTTAIETAADSLKNVDYTNSGLMLTDEDGNSYDAYDKQVEIAKDDIKDLMQFTDVPVLKSKHNNIRLAGKELTQVLAHKEAMKNKRDGYLGNLERLEEDYLNLIQRDPSLHNKDDWEDALSIIKDMEIGYNNLLMDFGAKLPAEKMMQYQEILEMHDLTSKAKEADINKDIKGFQVDLSDEASPFLQDLFKKMGMKETDMEGAKMGETTYMPEIKLGGRETKEYGELKDIYDTPDLEYYEDALKSYNSYRAQKLANSSANIQAIKVLGANIQDATVQEWLDELAVSDTGIDQFKLSLVANSILGHNQGEIDKANINIKKLGATDPNEEKRLNIMIDRIKRSPDLIESLGTLSEGMFKDIQQYDIEQTMWGDVPIGGLPELKAEALRAVNELNISMKGLDPDRKAGMDIFYEVEDLKDMTPSRVMAYQRNISERLNTLIAQDVGGPLSNPENEVAGRVSELMNKFLKSIENSDLTGQKTAIRNLRGEFIGLDGARLRRADVNSMWDNDNDQIEVFYRLLEAFGELDKINPRSAEIYWGD